MYKSPWSIWKFHWRNRNNNRITIATIAAFLLAMALPYSLINHIMGNIDRSVLDPAIGLDSWTPYICWTFIIYVSFYLYYPAVAWYGRGDDSRVRELLGFCQALFIMTWVVNLIFIIFPTEVYIREQIPQSVRSGEGFWGFWFGEIMHNVDYPYNAWPSLHVVQSLIIVLLLRHWKVVSGLKELFLWIAWLALCVSIMTTKQHFFFDLVTGIITGLFCWYCMCIPAMKASSNAEWCKAYPSDQSVE